MISLKPALKMERVLAKLMIWLRTTLMPLSSEAFSSKTCSEEGTCHGLQALDITLYLLLSTIELNCCGVYSSLAQARIVLVFPVPGGP